MSSKSGQSTDISKLTVPQLKAICKDKKLTGYSKLTKNALLQKLAECGQAESRTAHSSPNASVLGSGDKNYIRSNGKKDELIPSSRPSVSNVECSQTAAYTQVPVYPKVPIVSASPAPSVLPALPSIESIHQGKLTSALADYARPLSTMPPPVLMLANINVPNTKPNAGSKIANISVSAAAQDRVSSLSIPIPPSSIEQLASCAKRPLSKAYASPVGPPIKKTKVENNTSTKTLPSAAFEVPSRAYKPSIQLLGRVVPSPTTSTTSTNIATNSSTCIDNKLPRSTFAAVQRFKPLVVNKVSRSTAVSTVHLSNVSASSSIYPNSSPPSLLLYSLDFPSPSDCPRLGSISLPPSLSQRKRVQRWAVILSGLSNAERAQCMLVSRTFRYAVYLSASVILSRRFNGIRLSNDIKQYSQAMTNFWPYLRLREAETNSRKHMYDSSFLFRFFECRGMMDFNAVSEKLWGSPDHEKQLVVALRFVTTCVWFAVSLGIGLGEGGTASCLNGTVSAAQEIVPHELWSITISYPMDSATLGWPISETFYVLESTCEVVGHLQPVSHSFSANLSKTQSIALRSDWSAYISNRMQSSSTNAAQTFPPTLLEHLRWANYEEYYRGVSKLWLRRIEKEGALGDALGIVAQRYTLANVVGNSVSGDWKSTTEMSQEFAGLNAPTSLSCAKSRVPVVNLYLPAHHHVESVHFSTANGILLHTALAIVQTLHRAYYILRDNGMQVGCEEDGVAEIWQRLVGCDSTGVSL